MKRPASRHVVTLIPGDGIGPEVSSSVEAIFATAQVPVVWDRQVAGARVFRSGDASGVPSKTIESIRRNGIALKGPLETPVGFGEKSANVTLRKHFETYGNIRPVRELPGIRTPYSGRGIDFVVVRENVEDLYAGIEYRPTPCSTEALKVITREGSEKICRLAFELARAEGRKKVTCATKANILKFTEGMFKTVFEHISADYKDIESEHLIVDNCAHLLVARPEQFDVLVMTNMNGDILSDLASALIGGLGFAPSANLGSNVSIFEAVHGSAPSIAGRDMANPTALISTSVMMLRHLGELGSAQTIENALLVTLEEGKSLTPDVSGPRDPGGTQSFTQQIIKNLGRKPKSYPLRVYKRLRMSPAARSAGDRAGAFKTVDVGVDIFLETRLNPRELGPRAEAIANNLAMNLAHISDRGAVVYPAERAHISASGTLRLRFVSAQKISSIDDAALTELLRRLSTIARWTQVYRLANYDGMPSYTKAQGEN